MCAQQLPQCSQNHHSGSSQCWCGQVYVHVNAGSFTILLAWSGERPWQHRPFHSPPPGKEHTRRASKSCDFFSGDDVFAAAALRKFHAGTATPEPQVHSSHRAGLTPDQDSQQRLRRGVLQGELLSGAFLCAVQERGPFTEFAPRISFF